MLILSRRKNESVIIAGEIKVTVLDIAGGKIKLGFDAPSEVGIDREEIHLAKRQNQAKSRAERLLGD